MKTAYINGILLDGTESMKPEIGWTIITEGEKIVAVTKEANLDSCEVIDLNGKYIMPGLVNMHVHLPASGKPKKKQTDAKKLVKLMTSCNFLRNVMIKLCEGYAKTQLLSGVTTIRTVGGVEDVDTRIRDRIAKGEILGPRILASNMAVSVPGGHMAGSLAYEVTTAEQAKEIVKKIAEDRPDLIKLMITGGVLDAKVKGEPGEVKMSADIIKASCDEAHELGLKVAAHVESPQGVKLALENGVDTIEHGAKPDAEIIALFKEKKACHIATFSPALPFALFDSSISHASEIEKYNGYIVFEGIIECAKACLENGIPVGLGTDTGCPYITQYDMYREINYFHKYCGVSPAFALHTATLVNAELAGLKDQIGSIEEGKIADMIVCDKNPLEDLSVLHELSMVICKGKRIENPKVKKMPQVERELDKYL